MFDKGSKDTKLHQKDGVQTGSPPAKVENQAIQSASRNPSDKSNMEALNPRSNSRTSSSSFEDGIAGQKRSFSSETSVIVKTGDSSSLPPKKTRTLASFWYKSKYLYCMLLL